MWVQRAFAYAIVARACIMEVAVRRFRLLWRDFDVFTNYRGWPKRGKSKQVFYFLVWAMPSGKSSEFFASEWRFCFVLAGMKV